MAINPEPGDKKKIQIVVNRVEQLSSKDIITKVEFDPQTLQAVGNFFIKSIVEDPTALMILLSPPGQSGSTRYIDTAVDLPQALTNGETDFAFFIKNYVKTQPGLGGHKIAGFASVYPVRDKLQNAFDTGFSVWATLGNELITEPLGVLETDFSSMTIWSQRENGQIRPIDAVVLPERNS